ncbi:HipA domain-containing protein [Acidovorax temperans]|nr:HipA domain-containing protein [Acidovorax temperans]
MGHSDCHLKNISFLSNEERARVAPYYDLCTAVNHTRVSTNEHTV